VAAPRSRSLRGLDLPAAGAVTGGLALLVLALARAERAGALGLVPLASLAAAVALLAAFAARERTSARPLVPPRLLRTRAVVAALLAAAVLTATTSGGAVLATLHLQDVLGMAPARAGLVLLPLSIAVVAGSVAAARLRAGAPALIAGGVALVAAGSAVASTALTSTGGAAGIAAWGLLAGLGLGGASVAATTLGASAVAEADRGTVAGLLNTAAQVGTAVGVAALVLVSGMSGVPAGHRLGFAAAAAVAALGAHCLRRLAPPARPPRRPAAQLSPPRRSQQ
jgi:predicted MFS family arabinose efflux permease